MCSKGNNHSVRRTFLSQLAGNARGFCGPGSPLTTCLSKKTMQIPAHAAQIQDQNTMLVLAHQKEPRADILSATPQLVGPHLNAGPLWQGSAMGSQGLCWCCSSAAGAAQLCHCCILMVICTAL